MGSSQEMMAKKSGDYAPVKVTSVWERSRRTIRRAVSQFSDKSVPHVFGSTLLTIAYGIYILRLRRTFIELTGQTGEKVEYVTIVDGEKQKHKVKKADAVHSWYVYTALSLAR